MVTHSEDPHTFITRAVERKGANVKPAPKPAPAPSLELTLADAFNALGEGECQDWAAFWGGAIDRSEVEGAAS